MSRATSQRCASSGVSVLGVDCPAALPTVAVALEEPHGLAASTIVNDLGVNVGLRLIAGK